MRVLTVLSLWLLGCHGWVIRDRNVYLSEMAFADRLVREGAPAVHDLVLHGCTCESGSWHADSQWLTDSACQNYAAWWAVYTARWAWHRQIGLYNSRSTDTRPGPAPTIPPPSCTLQPNP